MRQSWSNWRIIAMFGFAFSVACVDFGFADDKDKDAKPKAAAKADKPAAKPVVPITADREAAALEFARTNHPELASLLDGLKKNAPKEYDAALADLDRTVDRLSKLKEKSVERYEIDLADWKITSRIRLLAARLSMNPDVAVEAELRAALRERLDMRLAAQRSERDRLQSRVAKLNQTIDDTSAKSDAIIEKQFADLRKSMPAKPAAKTKPKKSDKPAATSADAKGEKQ